MGGHQPIERSVLTFDRPTCSHPTPPHPIPPHTHPSAQIKKDKSLSKYEEFEAYKKRTWTFLPFLW